MSVGIDGVFEWPRGQGPMVVGRWTRAEARDC